MTIVKGCAIQPPNITQDDDTRRDLNSPEHGVGEEPLIKDNREGCDPLVAIHEQCLGYTVLIMR